MAKKIFILVPDGTGIKNYLYTRVFREITCDLCMLHDFDNETLQIVSTNIAFSKVFSLPDYNEGFKERFLRELIHLTRLKYIKSVTSNPTILDARKKQGLKWKLKIFYGFVALASTFVRSYKTIARLEKKYERAIRNNRFYEQVRTILERERPDVLFCTHQRALKAPTVFAAARDLGIPSTTVIYSWDNIPKARLALKADKYLVWSDYMKNELQEFYPDLPPESIRVTGTPQFEFYFERENIIDMESFYSNYNLNPNKKIICFSGDDERTSPNDPQYLEDLALSIKEHGLEFEFQIVFRRCPVDVSGRYDEVIKTYSDIIVEVEPLWNYNTAIWSAVYPTNDDVKLLVSLAYYADMVVNVGSTMAFDFGMFDKPCLFINYDHSTNQSWSVDTIYKYQHFRSMPGRNAVYWLDDRKKIAEVVSAAASNPRTEIRKWFEIIAFDPENASNNIANELM